MNIMNIDCMKHMRNIADNYYDLAIVDPPYYNGPQNKKYYGKLVSKTNITRGKYKTIDTWDIPSCEYFKELLRVSKHQIIWGINYFEIQNLGSGRIVWDKCNSSSSFADVEIAYCSKIKHTKLFRFMWNGMNQGKSIGEGHIMQGNKSLNEKRIHPTQKPIILYKWLLSNYASTGDKILDTHGGSMSSAIACNDLGFDIDICELNPHYFELGARRIQQAMCQAKLL